MTAITSGDGVLDRGPVVVAITIALLIVSTVFVTLRLISRVGIVKKVTLDDWFIVLSWVGATTGIFMRSELVH